MKPIYLLLVLWRGPRLRYVKIKDALQTESTSVNPSRSPQEPQNDMYIQWVLLLLNIKVLWHWTPGHLPSKRNPQVFFVAPLHKSSQYTATVAVDKWWIQLSPAFCCRRTQLHSLRPTQHPSSTSRIPFSSSWSFDIFAYSFLVSFTQLSHAVALPSPEDSAALPKKKQHLLTDRAAMQCDAAWWAFLQYWNADYVFWRCV